MGNSKICQHCPFVGVFEGHILHGHLFPFTSLDNVAFFKPAVFPLYPVPSPSLLLSQQPTRQQLRFGDKTRRREQAGAVLPEMAGLTAAVPQPGVLLILLLNLLHPTQPGGKGPLVGPTLPLAGPTLSTICGTLPARWQD